MLIIHRIGELNPGRAPKPLVNALRDCYDTLQQRNIVDLGLVRSASVTRDAEAPGANVRGVGPRYIARITLQAPSSDDTRNAQLRAQIENRLAGLPAISLPLHVTSDGLPVGVQLVAAFGREDTLVRIAA